MDREVLVYVDLNNQPLLARWRHVATHAGLQKAGINRMASAFDHEDLKRARRVLPGGREQKGVRA
jgi:hypothetical protein